MSIIKYVPSTVQPKITPSIDRGNPINVGLVGLLDGSGIGAFRDLATGIRAPAITGTTSPTPSGLGVTQATQGGNAAVADNRYTTRQLTNWYLSSGPLTLALKFVYSASTGSCNLGGAMGSANEGYFLQALFGTGDIQASAFVGGSRKTAAVGGTALTAGGSYLAVLTLDGVNLNLYVNGRLYASTAASGSLTYDTSFGRVQLGGNGDYNAPGGTYQYMALWNRALSDGEVKSLSNNPWQLFAPRRILVPVSAGGGGTTYTISPSGGITFGGSVPQVRTKLYTPSGGITFSGTVNLIHNKLYSPSGGITFGGTAPMTCNGGGGSTITPERTKVGVGA